MWSMGVEHVFVEYDPSRTNQFDLGFRKHVHAIELSHFEIAGMTITTGTGSGSGATGAQGPIGLTGATGAAGAAGAEGHVGHPGVEGPVGPAGPAGPIIFANLVARKPTVNTSEAQVVPTWDGPPNALVNLRFTDPAYVQTVQSLSSANLGNPVILDLFDPQFGEQHKLVTLRVILPNGQYVEDTVNVHFLLPAGPPPTP